MQAQYQHGDDLRPWRRARGVLKKFFRNKVVPKVKALQRRRAFASFMSKRKFPRGTGIAKHIMGFYKG
jgi:hypothetical protein